MADFDRLEVAAAELEAAGGLDGDAAPVEHARAVEQRRMEEAANDLTLSGGLNDPHLGAPHRSGRDFTGHSYG